MSIRSAPALVMVCSSVLWSIWPEVAGAWNSTGHEVVASIAFDELTTATRNAAINILKQHPRYEKDLLLNRPESFDPDRYAFMIASTWPDIVRSEKHPMHFVANHPVWHYVDIPYVIGEFKPGQTQPVQTQPATTEPSASSGPRDLLEALTQVTDQLKDPRTPPADRAIALCWLLHLCGDVHQPLHAISLYSAQFPGGDRGGNAQFVLPAFPQGGQSHTEVNLHFLWDSLLGVYHSPELIDYLASGLRNDPRFSRANLEPRLRVHDFARWAAESHQLAIDKVYLRGTLKTLSIEKLHGEASGTPGVSPSTRSTERLGRPQIPVLPDGYIQDAEGVAMRQITLAGYRTADLLNAILVSPDPKP